MPKKSIAIIGGGASALMLAAHLDETKFDVTIYERNTALGRKFLVAGDGGLNITHSEPLEKFIQRYEPTDFFQNIITNFSNTDLISWLQNIGVNTFIGTSGRVFPEKNSKPIEVLNAVLDVLKNKNVTIKTNYLWKGWNEKTELQFETKAEVRVSTKLNNKMVSEDTNHSNTEIKNVKSDFVIFALGGKSWRITGSDGNWTNYFSEKEIEIIVFEASNCAVKIDWKTDFLKIAEGESLKNILIKCGDNERKGEVVITKFGFEGGAVYALTSAIRKQLKNMVSEGTNQDDTATIYVDLKPIFSHEEILEKLNQPKKNSINNHLETKIGLSKTAINLLKFYLSKEEFTDMNLLSKAIKNFPLNVVGLAPIDEAISTVGGISLAEINENFELNKLPRHFCIGEMLDWNAPTGGYLLQGNFSMGFCLAKYLNAK
ncbi:MAG: hypothetical protein RL708_1423 [Bacteroidota bacterium]|jgi:uncharacterized flavoprotein (TIGR03862 family)